MLPVDNSAISKSTSENNNAVRKSLLQGKSSSFDRVFPLVDQIAHHTDIPSEIYIFISNFFYLQVLFSALWPLHQFYDSANSTITSTLAVLSKVFWLLDVNYDLSYLTMMLVIVASLFFLAAGWIIFELVYYSRHHRFMVWTLYVSRLISDVISPLMLHPAAAFTGASFHMLVSTGNKALWFYMIIGAMAFTCFRLIDNYAFALACRSAYIVPNTYSMFEPESLNKLALLSPVIVFMSFVLTIYPKWTTLLIQACHFAICIHILIKDFNLPFHMVTSSALNAAYITAAASLDITMGAMFLVPTLFPYIPAIGAVSTLILSYILYIVLFTKKVESIRVSLTNDDENPLSSDDKNTRFIQLGLDQNELKALIYLRFGYELISDLFVDWSLLHFIVQNHTSNYSICSCIQMLSFFPGETRQLNLLFSNATSRRDLSFADRFLIYQVNHVRIIRQSSVSSDSNDRLLELKTLSKQCEADIRSFWSLSTASTSVVEDLGSQMQNIKALWDEAVRDYPNNSKICDEYSRFLSECMTDFDLSIVKKHRAELIELGFNFSYDLAFRSLVASFPDYVKKNVIDLKGNIITKKSHKKGSHSSDHKDSSGPLSATSELDAELEESMARKLFKQPKTRLALHHSLKDRMPMSLRWLSLAAALTVFCICFSFVYLYLNMDTQFNRRSKGLNTIYLLAHTRFYSSLSNILLLFKYNQYNGRFSNGAFHQSLVEKDVNLQHYLNLTSNFSVDTMSWTLKTRESLSDLLHELSDLSSEGEKVYTIGKELLKDSLPIHFCHKGNYIGNRTTNLKNTMVYLVFLASRLSGDANVSNWFAQQDFCETMINYEEMTKTVQSQFNNFLTYQLSVGSALNKEFKVYELAFPGSLLLITLLPTLILSLAFNREIRFVLKVLLSLDPQTKEDAKMPLMKENEVDNDYIGETHNRMPVNYLIIFVVFLISICVSLLCYYFVTKCISINSEFDRINMWSLHGLLRLVYSSESLLHVLQTILLNDTLVQNVTTRAKVIAQLNADINQVIASNEFILQGDSTYPPCYGFDTQLDQINLLEVCSLTINDTTTHDIYRCISLNQALAVYKDMLAGVAANPDKFNGAISSEEVYHIIHISASHLWPTLAKFLDRLPIVMQNLVDQLLANLMSFTIIAFLLAIFSAIFTQYSTLLMKPAFVTAMMLVKRLPPVAIVNNKPLIDFLLNRQSSEKDQGMSISQSIIHNSSDAILCTGLSGIIEIVNPAVSSTFGFTPEQLLGQPISTVFQQVSESSISKQLTLMRNGQSASVFEDHVTCITDSATDVPCHVTILGMKGDTTDSIQSFVFILRNESLLLKQQQEAEEAKSQSEKLLFQILPRDIVIKLNSGEKDISFTVPSASIIFIDIVKFSEYSASLTPQEIMGNLSTVFAAFDSIIAKYPLLTKIKLIGDVYMAAAGLFSPNDPPQSHAEQMVRFGLECIVELEDINMKLNANLNVRVGINSGGPILAGVLGTDKPVFDIIGDPINVAARLQSTCIPGRIHISQATQELIASSPFEIEQRGEVFLKGKGKTTTYFVHPITNFMAQLSSAEFRSKPDVIAPSPSQ